MTKNKKKVEELEVFSTDTIGIFHGFENMFESGMTVEIVNENIKSNPKTFGDLKKQDVVKCGDRIMVCRAQKSKDHTVMMNIRNGMRFGCCASVEKEDCFDEYLGKLIVEELESFNKE